MTLEQKLRELLSNHGLWPDDVDAVIELVKADDETNELMLDRWNDPVQDYLPSILSALWIHTKSIALEYIDEVMPKAFFRPMFVD